MPWKRLWRRSPSRNRRFPSSQHRLRRPRPMTNERRGRRTAMSLNRAPPHLRKRIRDKGEEALRSRAQRGGVRDGGRVRLLLSIGDPPAVRGNETRRILSTGDPSGVQGIEARRVLSIGDPSGVQANEARRVLSIGDPSGVQGIEARRVLSIGDPAGVLGARLISPEFRSIPLNPDEIRKVLRNLRRRNPRFDRSPDA